MAGAKIKVVKPRVGKAHAKVNPVRSTVEDACKTPVRLLAASRKLIKDTYAKPWEQSPKKATIREKKVRQIALEAQRKEDAECTFTPRRKCPHDYDPDWHERLFARATLPRSPIQAQKYTHDYTERYFRKRSPDLSPRTRSVPHPRRKPGADKWKYLHRGISDISPQRDFRCRPENQMTLFDPEIECQKRHENGGRFNSFPLVKVEGDAKCLAVITAVSDKMRRDHVASKIAWATGILQRFLRKVVERRFHRTRATPGALHNFSLDM